MKEYSLANSFISMRIMGIMSGTSLDGLDIAVCDFSFDGKYHYAVVSTESIEYNTIWKKRLHNAFTSSAYDLVKLSKDYGHFIGSMALRHLKKHKLDIDFIASHGHTVFHVPTEGVNLQIGDGSEIAVNSGIPTIFDFRSADIAYKGTGAPLVPIADLLLFPDFVCLNLGGFSNISYNNGPNRIAYDICPVNIALNYLSSKHHSTNYDDKGKYGKYGLINSKLLNDLNALEYYHKTYPKSLGREWYEKHILPLIDSLETPVNDIFATYYEHIAIQLCNNIPSHSKVLVTGGGAYNSHLIKLMQEKSDSEIIIPKKELIEFKEAIIFAFLGFLRATETTNCLSTVTGAQTNAKGGTIAIP